MHEPRTTNTQAYYIGPSINWRSICETFKWLLLLSSLKFSFSAAAEKKGTGRIMKDLNFKFNLFNVKTKRKVSHLIDPENECFVYSPRGFPVD